MSQRTPRSVPEIPNLCSVLLGLFGPLTHSTSEVGAPAIGGAGFGFGAGGAGTGAAFGATWPAFGGDGLPPRGRGGVGAGTAACCCSGAERRPPGFNNDDISGPSLGSGARSLVPRGRRPVGSGPSRALPGEVTAALGGGAAFAASPLHGTAVAAGERPTATVNPVAAADAMNKDTIRGIGDMSYLSRGRTPH